MKSESIAVDWVGRNLYWLDGLASQILAVRLGTSTVKSQNYIVVLDEDLEQPRSLLLLPHKGWVRAAVAQRVYKLIYLSLSICIAQP